MTDETDPVRSDAPRTSAGAVPRRSGGSRLLLLPALVGGLVVATLCLNAADSGGDSVTDGVGPLHGEWLPVMLVVAVGGWYLAAKYQARQNERPMGTAREGRLAALTVTALALTVLGTAVTVTAVGLNSGRTAPAPTALPPPGKPSAVTRTMPPQPGRAGTHVHVSHPISLAYVLLALLALGVLGLLVVVLLLARRYLGRRVVPEPELVGTPEPAPEEEALSDAVSAGRLALAGEDVRAAVIACYAAMEDSLAVGGLGRRASDSPADLLRRAAEAGLLQGPAPERLADLFREARYSSHPMTRQQLDLARAALDEIGTLLAARAAAREAEAAREAAAGADALTGGRATR